MGRTQTKTELLSLDSISLINKLYPKSQDFYQEHLSDTDVTILNFYSAMRREPITPDHDRLIDSCLDWKLRQMGEDRDSIALKFYALVPTSKFLEQLIELVEGYMQVTRNRPVTCDAEVTQRDADLETQSQVLFQLKLRAQTSKDEL